MPPAPARLVALRNNTAAECAANGFVCRGAGVLNAAVGGGCTLTCQTFSTVFQIDVAVGGPDWFIPYGGGEARFCDIPRGQPNGTLVVTYPMNGCALEVRRHGANTNRFYHDADGNSMPAAGAAGHPAAAHQQFRADAAAIAGPGARAEAIFAAHPTGMDAEDGEAYGQNFEHTVICVKNGANWDVYQTAVIITAIMGTGNQLAFMVPDGPPVHLGQFAD